MYDLTDIQSLFDSTESRETIKTILDDNNIHYEDRGNHFLVDKIVIVFLHKRMILLRESQPSETYFVNNKHHIEKLSQLLTSVNEGTSSHLQE